MNGRPSIYTTELAELICWRMSNGEALKEICADPGMPCAEQVRKWNIEDRDGFAALYARAREARADYWAEEIIEIADSVQHNATNEEIQAARLRSENRKWIASKLLHKKYGDRVVHAGDDNAPVQIVERIELVPVKPRAVDAIDTDYRELPKLVDRR